MEQLLKDIEAYLNEATEDTEPSDNEENNVEINE